MHRLGTRMCRVLYVVGTQRFVADPDAIDDTTSVATVAYTCR